MEQAVLQHLLGSARGSGASRAAAAFDSAASQLQLLGGQARRSGQAGELAEELLDKAEQLVGSKQATSRLLGLQLLRSAVANCHRRAFLQQHAQWAALLLATLRAEQQRGQQADKDAPSTEKQQPSAVAAEACACLAAYFSRVGRMLEVPGLRRDGAAAASKLAGILLSGQGQKQQVAAAQAAMAPPPLLALAQGQAALLAALTALPASFRQQHKALEAALLPLLMAPAAAASGGGGSPLLAACAAALPRIAGDGSSWSAFCQRLMVTAHSLLDSLLLQLDDAQLAAAAKSAVDPSAEPLPLLPAAGSAGALGSDAYAAAFGQLAAVLETLHQMLAGSYPAAVPLPAGCLLLLASRITSVDDSSGGRAATAAAASSRFPQLCLQLPQMQAAALRLLQQLLAVAGSAAAPYFVAAARTLGDLLQRAAAGGGAVGTSSAVRCRLFGATRTLLDTAGVGAVRPLSPPLLAAATAELYGRKHAAQQEGDGLEGPARKKARKGKQAAATDFAGEAAAAAPLDDLGATAQLRDQAVQAAALAALEALCTAGAPLLTHQQRRQLDDVAIHVAATSAAAVCQLSCDAEAAVGANLAVLQLSAHRLLLATVLAPAPHRPPHLAAALRLWRAGSAGGAGGAVPAFCRHALLCCEALLHPRSMPPPAPVRRVLPSALEAGADGSEEAGQPLGMPRFWSSVDAGLLLQQEELAVQRQLAARPLQQAAAVEAQQMEQPVQQQQPQTNGTARAADVEMADAAAPVPLAQLTPAAPTAQPSAIAAAAPAAAVPPSQPVAAPAPVQQAPAAGLSSMAAMLGRPAAAAPEPAAAPTAPSLAAAPAAAAPQPAAAAAAPTAEFAAAPAPLAAAPAPAAAAIVAAAAAEESDSEGSLPDIDSGEESGGSDSDEA